MIANIVAFAAVAVAATLAVPCGPIVSTGLVENFGGLTTIGTGCGCNRIVTTGPIVTSGPAISHSVVSAPVISTCRPLGCSTVRRIITTGPVCSTGTVCAPGPVCTTGTVCGPGPVCTTGTVCAPGPVCTSGTVCGPGPVCTTGTVCAPGPVCTTGTVCGPGPVCTSGTVCTGPAVSHSVVSAPVVSTCVPAVRCSTIARPLSGVRLETRCGY